MSEQTRTLEEMFSELSPPHRDEVRDFVEFLLARQGAEPRAKPGFSWAGALSDLRDRYTSVDLQHLIARWRVEGE